MANESKELTVRVHDECAYLSLICTNDLTNFYQ